MSDIRPVRILLAGIAVFLATLAVVFLVVTGYAFKLAFEARGQPDQEAIQLFANRVAPWLGPAISVVLSLLAGFWVAGKASARKVLNGTLVGGTVGVIELGISVITGLSATDLLGVALPVAAAWLGGIAAQRRSGAPTALGD